MVIVRGLRRLRQTACIGKCRGKAWRSDSLQPLLIVVNTVDSAVVVNTVDSAAVVVVADVVIAAVVRPSH